MIHAVQCELNRIHLQILGYSVPGREMFRRSSGGSMEQMI